MPDPTLRMAVIDVVETRLAAIQTAKGYATDAGRQVQIGEQPQLGPSDPVVGLAVFVGDDDPVYEGERLAITLPIDIEIVTQVGRTDGWKDIERALGDVKRAMETNTAGHRIDGPQSPQLQRGVTRTLPREEGSTYMGAVIRYTVGPYREGWGQP